MTTNGGPARLVRVYGLWILLITAVVMAAAYGVSTLAPTVYRSAAIVVVEARVRANTTPVAPEMGTEKELAHSGLVVQPAARELGVDPGTLGEGLTVSVAPDANVLTFAYDDPSAAVARERAQALAEAYVAYRNAGETGSTASRTAAAANANAHATLVTPAYLPSVPQARPVWIDLGVGLALGLLLGVGTALLRDRLSDRVRGRDDFERISGATVLATVPRVRRTRGPGGTRPVLLRAPGSPAAESYRYLRSRLQPLLGRDGPAIVLVASAHEGEGRSTTAANLALALALAGRRVVLVDADLRRPGLHALFGLPGDRGLTTLLTGESGLADTLQDGPVPRLRLLAAGPGAGSGADLLEGPRLSQVLRTLRRQCDVVVLDSAAVLSVSDAIALAALSDHVLLVGDYRRTTRGALARALVELREVVHGNVSGVLVNAPKSAGGLVPRPRIGGGEPLALPDGLPDAEEDRAGFDRRGPVQGSAAVHASFGPPSAAPASTVYTSAAAPVTGPAARGVPVIHNGRTPGGPAGPVKARANGVESRPADRLEGPGPRGGEHERSLEPRG
jgi:capsular exopolysaccharide synthesis family protein